MKIEVKDHLTEDRMKELCEEEYRYVVRKYFEHNVGDWMKTIRVQNIETFLSNLSYEMVMNAVNEKFDIDMEKLLVENMHRVVSELSTYTVFHDDGFNSKKSKGYELIEQEVENARPLIKERIEKFVNGYDFSNLTEDIPNMVADAISEKLFLATMGKGGTV